MPRTQRSPIRAVRIAHRWISLTFVVAAAVLIVQIVPPGDATTILSTVAIALLLLLVASGLWMAVHHYVVKFRYARPHRTTVGAGERR